LCNVAAQSFQFDDQFIIHGVIDAADMKNYHGDKHPLCVSDRLFYRNRSTVLLMFDEDDAGRFCREQTMLRLCDRLYVRVFKFAEEGQQPEHLTPEQVQELAGGVL